MKLKIAIISILFFCTGCTSVGTPFKPIDGVIQEKSKAYLYLGCEPDRKEYLGDGQTGASVYVNQKFIGYLSLGTYIPLVLPAGKYKFRFEGTWNWTSPPLEFTYSIGNSETHYFEWASRWDDHVNNKLWYELTEKSASEAEPKLKNCFLESKSYLKAKKMGLSQ